MVPFEKISIDIKRPIPSRKFNIELNRKSFYIMVVIDAYSRYTETCYLQNIRSEEICYSLEKCWLKRYTSPSYVLTDQGRQFVSSKFK